MVDEQKVNADSNIGRFIIYFNQRRQ